MPAAKPLTGQTFGRLTVLERYGSRQGRVNWLCRCECGKLHEAVSHALTSGHTKSCGCWKTNATHQLRQLTDAPAEKLGYRPRTNPGVECGLVALTQRPSHSRVTAREVCKFATAGKTSETFLRTWGNVQTEELSTVLMLTGATSHRTVDGRRDRNKQ